MVIAGVVKLCPGARVTAKYVCDIVTPGGGYR
jgi:hypothetical protein